jgi:hypothetical protein
MPPELAVVVVLVVELDDEAPPEPLVLDEGPLEVLEDDVPPVPPVPSPDESRKQPLGPAPSVAPTSRAIAPAPSALRSRALSLLAEAMSSPSK